YGFPSAGERLGRLDEGVQIMRQAWERGRATLDGKHYRVDDAICAPRPSAGRIPLWIAGGGERKTLRIAAKYADFTNFDGTPEGFAHKSAVLQQHCTDLGRDYDSIVRSANYNVIVGETSAEVDRRLDALEQKLATYVPADAAKATMGAFRGMPAVGTPQQVIDNLSGMIDRGMSYGIFYFPDIAHDTAGLELFEQQVMPALR
ncbi:MAG: LLM class flavin-dependent oxidoreductase, partial [Actinomycetota bacterium]|nr:LLM class flavin-dependent oxidoreductase [Actinomycetota bacterium]